MQEESWTTCNVKKAILQEDDANYFRKIFCMSVQLISKETSKPHTEVCLTFVQDIFKSDNVSVFEAFFHFSSQFIEAENNVHPYLDLKTRTDFPPMTITRFIGLMTMEENLKFIQKRILTYLLHYGLQDNMYTMIRLFYRKIVNCDDNDILDIFYNTVKTPPEFLLLHFKRQISSDVQVVDLQTTQEKLQKHSDCSCGYTITKVVVSDVQKFLIDKLMIDRKSDCLSMIICDQPDEKKLFGLLEYYFSKSVLKTFELNMLLARAFETPSINLLEFTLTLYREKWWNPTSTTPEISVTPRLFNALTYGFIKTKRIDMLRYIYKIHSKTFNFSKSENCVDHLLSDPALDKKSDMYHELVWILHRMLEKWWTNGNYDSLLTCTQTRVQKNWSFFQKHVIDHSLLDRDTINLICSFI